MYGDEVAFGMAYELLFHPLADEAMMGHERDRTLRSVLAAVNETLDRLERDPYEPRLATRSFVTEAYGGVRVTPLRRDSWYVLWQPSEISGTIEIILVHRLEL